MKNKFKIRFAKLDDLPEVKKILSRCNLPVEGLDEHFGEKYSVAERNGKIIGVAGIETYRAYGLLRSVVVDQSWQGKSIGESLVRDRLNWAKSKGLVEVFLLTIDTDRYFKRFGFRQIEREFVPAEIRESFEFSSVCPKSAVVMVKHLK